MKVIGIGGQLGSGKDTLADYLAVKLNEKALYIEDRWKRIGFAHAVKKVFMDTFDVTWEFIEEWKRKDEIPPGFCQNVRKSLQFIGDGFRKIQSDIWIQTAFRHPFNVIISDVRYLNEAEAIHERKGLTVLVWREGWENNDSNPSEAQIKPTVDWFVKSGLEGDVRNQQLPADEITCESQHVSHTCAPRLFDFFLRNEGSLEDLYAKVDRLILPALEKQYAG